MIGKIVIDGENAIMGRLASYAAKQALQGKEIAIVNADKVMISGSEKDIMNNFLIKRRRGGTAQKGPIIPMNPEKMLKRVIRGMLPKQGRGEIALKRIKCYNGIPDEFKDAKKIKSGKQKKEYINLGKIKSLIKK